MRGLRWFSGALFAALVASATPAAAERPVRCPDAATTLEMNACLGEELAAAKAEQRRYLDAATDRAADRGELVAAIMQSQAAFETYRKAECDAVYENWKDGTIRGAMALSCRIALTRSRTHGIWGNWLTYMDSTPPVLPEPVR